MSLRYEPASEPLHISAKWLFLLFGTQEEVDVKVAALPPLAWGEKGP